MDSHLYREEILEGRIYLIFFFLIWVRVLLSRLLFPLGKPALAVAGRPVERGEYTETRSPGSISLTSLTGGPKTI